MRTRLFFLVMILGFYVASPTMSQNWISRTTPTTEDLVDIYFASNDSGWAVGDNGTILFSSDGGETWGLQNTSSPQNLRNVFFIDNLHGWAVGENGTVFHTTNGGLLWAGQIIENLTNDLEFITFADLSKGWILATSTPYNQNLTYTENGGSSWQVRQGPIAQKLYAMQTIGNDSLWITSINGQAFFSDDGGTTWQSRSSGLQGTLHSIVFSDSSTGWVSNDRGRIWHTDDAGIHWSEQTTPISGQIARIYRLAFVDSLNGWGASSRGLLFTDDGGANWQIKNNIVCRSVMFNSMSHGWAVGTNGQIWEYRAVDETIVADSDYLDELFQDTFHWIETSTLIHLPYDWTNYGLGSVDKRCTITEIGLYLASLIGASQFSEITNFNESEAQSEVEAVLNQLLDWQLGRQAFQPSGPNAWHDSLFFKFYTTEFSTPTVDYKVGAQIVSSLDNAYLAAGLLTVRGYCLQNPALGETSSIYAKCDSLLRRMDFMFWYDPIQQQFHRGAYQEPAGGDFFEYLSDEGRLINFIARTLDVIYGPGPYSSSEFMESSHGLIQDSADYNGTVVGFVSYDGSYSNYAAPALFVKENESFYSAVLDSATKTQMLYQQSQGYQFWGISDCFVSGIFSPRGCPPRGSGDPQVDPEDGHITPYASALALNSSFSVDAINNLYRIQYVYPSSYDPDFGFTDAVNLTNQLPSGFTHSLSQFFILLSILNFKDETIRDFFYSNPEVQQVHAEYLPVVPIELISFQGTREDNGILLQWMTAEESKNYGFEVQRRTESSSYKSIGFIPGAGTTSSIRTYRFRDHNPPEHWLYYRLKQLDSDGLCAFSKEIVIKRHLPEFFKLYSCYPNPCNAAVNIPFEIQKDEFVEITVYDLLGRAIVTLLNGPTPAGKHTVKWNGTDKLNHTVSSGLYLIQAEFGKIRFTDKILLLK